MDEDVEGAGVGSLDAMGEAVGTLDEIEAEQREADQRARDAAAVRVQARARGRAARGALSAVEEAEAQAAAAVADAEEMLAAGDESVAPAAVPPPEEGVYDEEELGEATGERF